MNGSVPSLRRRSHFTLVLPSQPGSRRRIGKPCSGRSGSPFCAYTIERVVARFANRDAAREEARVAAFGEKPLGARSCTPTSRKSVASGTPVHSLFDDHAVDLLRRHVRLGRAVRRAAVARAFDEVRARHRRKALQIGERELERPVDESVDEQRVLRGIDRRDAGVDAREVQIRRRDRPDERLQRCERRSRDFADRCARRRDERRSRSDRGRRRARHLGRIAGAIGGGGRRRGAVPAALPAGQSGEQRAAGGDRRAGDERAASDRLCRA